MTSAHFRTTQSPIVASALVVEPHLPQLMLILSALSTLGFDVTVAEKFRDARTVLAAVRPTLLVTNIRLQEYNGLHLVLRGRSSWPDLPSIVTSEFVDPVLRLEAERLGATFIAMPTTAEELSAAVYRTVLRPPFETAPVRAPFERRQRERRLRQAPGTAGIERRQLERRRGFAEALRDFGAPAG